MVPFSGCESEQGAECIHCAQALTDQLTQVKRDFDISVAEMSALFERQEQALRSATFSTKITELEAMCKEPGLRLDAVEASVLRCQKQVDNADMIQEHMHVAVNKLHALTQDGQSHCHGLISSLQTRVLSLEEKIESLTWNEEDPLDTIQESDMEETTDGAEERDEDALDGQELASPFDGGSDYVALPTSDPTK